MMLDLRESLATKQGNVIIRRISHVVISIVLKNPTSQISITTHEILHPHSRVRSYSSHDGIRERSILAQSTRGPVRNDGEKTEDVHVDQERSL